MKILVCGSRIWTSYERIAEVLGRYFPISEIIHGGCVGADAMAGDYAKATDTKCTVYPADWNRYGKAAGPIRNRLMLDQKPNLVIAFHEEIDKSKGTRDCYEEAIRRGIPVHLVERP